MLLRAGRLLVVMALVFATGAHWAALQSLAWTTMLASHLCTDSLKEAVSETFDGQHPCCLCKAIAAARKAERKSEATAPRLKFEYPPQAAPLSLIAPSVDKKFPLIDLVAEAGSNEPLVPPPRCWFV